ncbi:hypothetical protein G9A89_009881 [Geosiphon pyriformis]|nr:hypothetical protein G9A89_009881 [Geosiphon pyriformis]
MSYSTFETTPRKPLSIIVHVWEADDDDSLNILAESYPFVTTPSSLASSSFFGRDETILDKILGVLNMIVHVILTGCIMYVAFTLLRINSIKKQYLEKVHKWSLEKHLVWPNHDTVNKDALDIDIKKLEIIFFVPHFINGEVETRFFGISPIETFFRIPNSRFDPKLNDYSINQKFS